MGVSYEPSSRTDASMSPLKSKAAKEFGTPRPSLPPPERKGHPGKSSPMMEVFGSFSMVGVYETRKGLKFVHVTSEKFVGKFTILIFMDNRLSELEAGEWRDYSEKLSDFKAIGAQVVGVCTDSHVTVRTMLMNSAELKGIKFPIICDRDGDFPRAFGVLKVSGENLGAARALAVLDPEKRLVHPRLHNELTRARPDNLLRLVTRLQGNSANLKETISVTFNSMASYDAMGAAPRKNDKSNSATEQRVALEEEEEEKNTLPTNEDANPQDAPRKRPVS